MCLLISVSTDTVWDHWAGCVHTVCFRCHPHGFFFRVIFYRCYPRYVTKSDLSNTAFLSDCLHQDKQCPQCPRRERFLANSKEFYDTYLPFTAWNSGYWIRSHSKNPLVVEQAPFMFQIIKIIHIQFLVRCYLLFILYDIYRTSRRLSSALFAGGANSCFKLEATAAKILNSELCTSFQLV